MSNEKIVNNKILHRVKYCYISKKNKIKPGCFVTLTKNFRVVFESKTGEICLEENQLFFVKDIYSTNDIRPKERTVYLEGFKLVDNHYIWCTATVPYNFLKVFILYT